MILNSMQLKQKIIIIKESRCSYTAKVRKEPVHLAYDQIYAWSGLYLDGIIISLYAGTVSSLAFSKLQGLGFDPVLGILSVESFVLPVFTWVSSRF